MIDALSFGLGCLTSLALVIALGFLLSRVGPLDAHSQYDNTAISKPAPPTVLPHGPTPPPPPGPGVKIITMRVEGDKKNEQ